MWPARLGDEAEKREGTLYVENTDIETFIEEYRTGTAWKVAGLFSTYAPNKKVLFKGVGRLRFESREDFQNVMNSCQKNKLNPPSSFSSIFADYSNLPFPPYSPIAPFRGSAFGSWQQVLRSGKTDGKVYHYDMNSAYRWAAESKPLPDLKTGYKTTRFDDPVALYVVQFVHAMDRPGWGFYRGKRHHVITSEERDRFNLQNMNIKVLYGIGFKKTVSLGPLFSDIQSSFPSCYKRISRAFWGLFNSFRAVKQVGIKSGSQREISNPWYNPVWAAFITSRVKLRMADIVIQSGALNVCVDAVLCTQEMPTGILPGELKLVNEYPNGIWISGPGVWGSGDYVVKHAGFKEAGAVLKHLKK